MNALSPENAAAFDALVMTVQESGLQCMRQLIELGAILVENMARLTYRAFTIMLMLV